MIVISITAAAFCLLCVVRSVYTHWRAHTSGGSERERLESENTEYDYGHNVTYKTDDDL